MFSENGLIDLEGACFERQELLMACSVQQSVGSEVDLVAKRGVNYRSPKKKYCRGPLPPARVPLGVIPSYGKHLHTGFPGGNPGSRSCRLTRQQIKQQAKFMRDNPG